MLEYSWSRLRLGYFGVHAQITYCDHRSDMESDPVRDQGRRRRHAAGKRHSGKRGSLHGSLDFCMKAEMDSMSAFEARGALLEPPHPLWSMPSCSFMQLRPCKLLTRCFVFAGFDADISHHGKDHDSSSIAERSVVLVGIPANATSPSSCLLVSVRSGSSWSEKLMLCPCRLMARSCQRC